MRLDISTLAFATSIVIAAEALAFFVQYRVNKSYKGLEWWLLGAGLQTFGFFFVLALNVRSVWILAVFANPLIFAGMLALGIGIDKFLGRKVRGRIAAAAFAAYLLVYYYFILIDNSITGRAVVVSAASALIAIAIASALFRGRRKPFSGSALFAAFAFLAYGLAQLVAMTVNLVLPPLAAYKEYYETPIRMLAFIAPMIGSLLWSFGLIIMVNQRLNAENREEREKLELVFNMSPDAKLITRLDDAALVVANEGLFTMTGRSREELVGRSLPEAGIWDEAEALEAYLAELRDKGSVDKREAFFRRGDGSRLIGRVSGKVISIEARPHAISVIHDITELKMAEREVRSLLAEKELILKEVHHRIKNNMSTISSLLSLQEDSLEDPQAIRALEDAKGRIKTMMRLYETLYVSTGSSAMSIAYYLPPLVDEIISTFPEAASIRVEKSIEDFDLEVKQLQPLGIIVNELLTNIMKHAFGGQGERVISVSASRREGRVRVVVRDNGSGVPDSPEAERASGFGRMLAEALAAQLEGSIRFESGKGTTVTLEFD